MTLHTTSIQSEYFVQVSGTSFLSMCRWHNLRYQLKHFYFSSY